MRHKCATLLNHYNLILRKIQASSFGARNFHYLQLEKRLQFGYNHTCPRETKSNKEVGKMFFFNCNNTPCGTIWQILSQLCGFGC